MHINYARKTGGKHEKQNLLYSRDNYTYPVPTRPPTHYFMSSVSSSEYEIVRKKKKTLLISRSDRSFHAKRCM